MGEWNRQPMDRKMQHSINEVKLPTMKYYNMPDMAITSKLNFIIIAKYIYTEQTCKEYGLDKWN